MRIPSFLRFSFLHRNGAVQEIPEDTSSFQEPEPIEVVQEESVTSLEQNNQSSIILELERIEEFVVLDFGVLDVRVSVKTNAERERFIQILVLPTDRYKHKEQFRKLERRLIREVSSRIGVPRPHVQVRKMRFSSTVQS